MATHILLKNNTMPTDNCPTLAIDTSTSFLSIALEHQGEIRLFHKNVGTKQSEQILPQIECLFKEAGITAADLGCIVYAPRCRRFAAAAIKLRTGGHRCAYGRSVLRMV
ncbi:universal bacterial protein YeaZ [Mycobacteroides abscessus subsp. massiliense]|nr:universal bacterial protein YeaZ [Mycobacteroides abscessus subsp. massiliense]